MDSDCNVIGQGEVNVTLHEDKDLTSSEDEIETLAIWVEEHLI